jgi:hypothetical protein
MAERIQQIQRAFTAYAVERELGSGGMATVYLAHDKKHDRNDSASYRQRSRRANSCRQLVRGAEVQVA